MPRKPMKPKKGDSAKVNFVLSGDLLLKVDAIAPTLTEELGRIATRSDVVRKALVAFVSR